MSDIFISYAREDAPTAETLARVLEAEGWTVFWDRTIPPGKTFDEVIDAELSTAGCAIVLWSEAAVSSRWVRAEAGAALDRGVLIPVLIEDVLPPLAFRQIHAASLIDWQGERSAPELELVIDVVRRLVSGGPTAPSATLPKNGAKFKQRYIYCPACNKKMTYWQYIVRNSSVILNCTNCGSKLQHIHVSKFEKLIYNFFVGLGIIAMFFWAVIYVQNVQYIWIIYFFIISFFFIFIVDYLWYRYLSRKKPLQKIR